MEPGTPKRESSDMDPKRRTQLTEIAALAAPLVLVVFVRVVMTPASASAANAKAAAAPAAPVSAPVKPLTPEQTRAAEFVRSLEGPAALASLNSPLDHPKPPPPHTAPEAPKVAAEAPLPPQTPDPKPLEGLKLTATLRAGQGGGMAAINNKIYKVGDEIRPGFTLVSVDAAANTVEIKVPGGETLPLGREK
jgi:hypothetical protein